MNGLGVMLVWCSLQVTLAVSVALGLSYLLSRWSLRVSRTAVSMGSMLVLVLTVLAWSPWPRWSWLAASPPAASGTESSSHTPTVDESKAPETAAKRRDERGAAPSHPSTWQSFAQAFSAEMRQVQRRDRGGWSWQGYVALLFLSLASFGALHLMFGAIAVQRLRSRARPLRDPAVLGLVKELRTRLNLVAEVEVLESDELTIAATIGWRRPAILLSPDWSHWTPLELRLVVAHELAHIRNNDFLCFVCAKAGLAMHLYHPLVHWLVGRLQLDLELAADATAATIADNPAHYLRTLADMALRQTDRRPGWSARTFLPTRGTFIRRLEMLKNTPSLRWQPAAGLRMLAGGLLLGVGFVVVGMRGAVGADPPANRVATKTAAAMNSSDWVPVDAMAVVVVRPADLIVQKNSSEAVRLLSAEALKRFALQPEQVEQLTVLLSPSQEKGAPIRDSGFIVRLKAPGKIAPSVPKGASVSTKDFMGKTYTSAGEVAWVQVDPQTYLVGTEEDLKRLIANGREAKSPLVKSKHWQAIDSQPVVVAFDMVAVSRTLELTEAAPPPAIRAILSPLWSDASELYLACGLDGALKLYGMIQMREDVGVQKIKETLTSAQTLAKNMIGGVREQWSRKPAGDGALILTILDIADELLKSAQVEERAGNSLSVTASAPLDAERSASLQQSVVAARQAAQRTQSMNNLRQLALAMHIYHDAHGHFPPAVLKGKDNQGGVPHSWRVALLPYLDEVLYKAYKFDEPWDSESNRKVLVQMPTVFRAPEDKSDSVHASYFAVVGSGTAFSKPEGVAMDSISDGLSNTILLVEANQEIPWTKPVDLELTADKPLPNVGGWSGTGYAAAYCDGSVRFFAKGLEEKRVRALLSIAGNEAVDPQE
jgi:beta-lactamase regulating signal transducer with metallopeptidase domain